MGGLFKVCTGFKFLLRFQEGELVVIKSFQCNFHGISLVTRVLIVVLILYYYLILIHLFLFLWRDLSSGFTNPFSNLVWSSGILIFMSSKIMRCHLYDSLLSRDPKIEIHCTHARTNSHPNNSFLQSLQETRKESSKEWSYQMQKCDTNSCCSIVIKLTAYHKDHGAHFTFDHFWVLVYGFMIHETGHEWTLQLKILNLNLIQIMSKMIGFTSL